MKFMRLAVAAAFALAFGNAYAFHSGGVAECDGCHTMHNSKGNAVMGEDNSLAVGNSGPYLLQGTSPSAACLNCHQHAGDTGPGSYHISTPANEAQLDSTTNPSLGTTVLPANVPFQMSPGGDFGWLRKSYTYTPRGTDGVEEPGYEHGHNVIAADFGYAQDPRFAVSPGGTFPADKLACSSCHDPHGKFRRDSAGNIDNGRTPTSAPIANSGSYNSSKDPGYIPGTVVGVYRILGGTGYVVKSANYTFANQVPTAVAPGSYNKSESNTQVRVAYGSGMSEWCGNCHGSFVQSGAYDSTASNHKHPAGSFSAGTGPQLIKNDVWSTKTFAGNYNSYIKSGTLQAGIAANSFLTAPYVYTTDGNNGATPTMGPYNSMIPIEMGVTTYATLKQRAAVNNANYMEGATATATVQCLSCHRAHASGWASMVRWNMENEFLTIADSLGGIVYPAYDSAAALAQTSVSYPYSNSASVGRSAQEYQVAMYDRPATQYAPFQRSLCNKCHIKD